MDYQWTFAVLGADVHFASTSLSTESHPGSQSEERVEQNCSEPKSRRFIAIGVDRITMLLDELHEIFEDPEWNGGGAAARLNILMQGG